ALILKLLIETWSEPGAGGTSDNSPMFPTWGAHVPQVSLRSEEGVKKLETANIRLRKLLIINGSIFCFLAFRRFFHTFEGTVEPARTPLGPFL
ncbi:MAG TPA: hypothetical protein VNT26_03255, partial [Candidatus Sulfotelmatobacter sp.]|nr:hypothetical protein [Candidatus Sulfotelmatobacter sp.]